MGGQGIERREILRYIGIAAVAGSFPGFSRWAFACPQDHTESHLQSPSAKPGPYQPLFFSPQQFRMVEHLAEMIIPEDETPGAKRAGVAEFIDFMVANRVPVSTSRDLRSTEDAIAVPQLRFHFQWGGNELLMCQHSKKVMIDLFKAMGGEMWGMDDEPNRPGTSLHETGVCRFGNDPKTSVTNKWAQTHDVPNLYICDSSIFPSCTDKTTTMPIVAFAMRNCDHMLDNFKKGVHTRA